MASTIKVTNIDTPDGSGNITVDRPLSGSGASLTALNATQLTSGTLPMARLSGTLPALNGSALTNLPSSGVKQIVHAGLTTTPTLSSTTLTATGLTANITPSATTSKIQIHVHMPISAESNQNTVFVRFRLYRDSTAIGTVGTGASGSQLNVQWHTAFYIHSTDNYEEYGMQNFTGFFVDSPSSTSAITYSVKWAKAASSSGNALLNRVWANDDGNYLFNGASTIMLTEVDNG